MKPLQLQLLVALLEEARRHGAGATEYTVGDSAGWTNGPNYLTWSQKYNFTAGDTLGESHMGGITDIITRASKVRTMCACMLSSHDGA